jgi:hypothetical protein
MAYTLAQAAQAAGVNRSTVLRAIKSGNQLADMRSQRDAWQAIAERLTLRGPPPEPEKKPRSWWAWLRSTG